MSKVRHKILPSDRDITRALIKAQRKIEDPKHWCTGVFARNANGKMVSLTSPHFKDAPRFCALGATYIQQGFGHRGIEARGVLHRSSMHVSGKDVSQANDHMGHETVMSIYDYAIEQSRKKGQT